MESKNEYNYLKFAYDDERFVHHHVCRDVFKCRCI